MTDEMRSDVMLILFYRFNPECLLIRSSIFDYMLLFGLIQLMWQSKEGRYDCLNALYGGLWTSISYYLWFTALTLLIDAGDQHISFNLIEVKFKEAADRIFCGISWSVFPNYFFPYQSFDWVRWRVNEPISSWITKINSIPTFVLANANFIESHQSFGWFDFFFLSSNIIR